MEELSGTTRSAAQCCLSLPAKRKHAQVEISGKVKLELFHAEPWDAEGIWAKIFPSTPSLPFS